MKELPNWAYELSKRYSGDEAYAYLKGIHDVLERVEATKANDKPIEQGETPAHLYRDNYYQLGRASVRAEVLGE